MYLIALPCQQYHLSRTSTGCQIFKCDNNMVPVSAYSIYKALYCLEELKEVSCFNLGNMQPWIVRRILDRCPELSKFMFTTYFDLVTECSMYEWYSIVRLTYPHVEFPKRVLQKVVDFENTAARLRKDSKKKK